MALPGYALAAAAFTVTVVLLGNRRWPAALIVIALGVAYALVFKLDLATAQRAMGLHLPTWHVPQPADILTGAVLLALPQIPLSLGNSMLATRQIAAGLLPRAPPHRPKNQLHLLADEPGESVFGRLSGVPRLGRHGGALCVWGPHGRLGGHLRGVFLMLGLFFSQGFQRWCRFSRCRFWACCCCLKP